MLPFLDHRGTSLESALLLLIRSSVALKTTEVHLVRCNLLLRLPHWSECGIARMLIENKKICCSVWTIARFSVYPRIAFRGTRFEIFSSIDFKSSYISPSEILLRPPSRSLVCLLTKSFCIHNSSLAASPLKSGMAMILTTKLVHPVKCCVR